MKTPETIAIAASTIGGAIKAGALATFSTAAIPVVYTGTTIASHVYQGYCWYCDQETRNRQQAIKELARHLKARLDAEKITREEYWNSTNELEAERAVLEGRAPVYGPP